MSSWDEAENDTTTYQVVVNHEEQYSIWRADRELPAGWRAEGFTGPKKECLAHMPGRRAIARGALIWLNAHVEIHPMPADEGIARAMEAVWRCKTSVAP